jgi:VanZ family protein
MVHFDIAQLSSIRRPLLVLLSASLLALVVFAELPPVPRIFHVVQKLGHPGVFAVIAVVALLLQRKGPHATYGRPWLQYLRALVAAILLGGATEIVQLFTHRDPSIQDVWLDAQGAGCALVFCAGWDQRCRPDSRWDVVRHGYFLVGGIAALLILAPLLVAAVCYADRGLRFPIIVDPASPFTQYFLQASDPPFQSVKLPRPWGRSPSELALHVRLIRIPYAGLQIEEPSPDWSGYSTLAVKLINPDKSALEVNTRVNDRTHNQQFSDRFNAHYTVPARSRTVIEIPLSAIQAAPHGRTMDMRHIAMLGIFRSGGTAPSEMFLERVWLH